MGIEWLQPLERALSQTEQSVEVKCDVFSSGSLSLKVQQALPPPALYIPPAELILFSPKIQTSFIGTLLFS